MNEKINLWRRKGSQHESNFADEWKKNGGSEIQGSISWVVILAAFLYLLNDQ